MSWQANQKYSGSSIEEYGLSQTTTGTPYVWVSFITAGCDGSISWRGWLTSKAKLTTYKNLMKMGWNESLDDLANDGSSALNKEKEFEIETSLEEWTTKDGLAKSKIVVKWVNDPTAKGTSHLPTEKLHLLKVALMADLAAVKLEEKNKTRLPPILKEASGGGEIPF